MKILTFGEILLRLAAPGYSRLFQKDTFDISFCGGEANVAVSLAMFGMESAYLTTLPDNDVGRAAANSLRYFGVDIGPIVFGDGRLGIYFLEKGASQRPSKVIYDRKYSAFSLSKKEDYDWDSIFKGVQWFHWTGITPSLSEEMIEIIKEALTIAREKGIIISCDLNYRSKLWSPEKAKETISNLLPYVDVCIANEEDAEKTLGIKIEYNDIERASLNREGYEFAAEEICKAYGCKYVAFTLRESYNANINGWSAMLYSKSKSKAYFSRKYEIQIVDRVGSGDSFAAGVIYGLASGKSEQETIDFSVASSCLKHTIEGDFNRTSVFDVESLLSSGGNGRVQR